MVIAIPTARPRFCSKYVFNANENADIVKPTPKAVKQFFFQQIINFNI